MQSLPRKIKLEFILLTHGGSYLSVIPSRRGWGSRASGRRLVKARLPAAIDYFDSLRDAPRRPYCLL